MRALTRLWIGSLAVALTFVAAAAEAKKPDRLKDVRERYWIGHGVSTGVFGVAALITGAAIDHDEAYEDRSRTPKPTALALSNATLTLELLAPVPALGASTGQVEFANFGLTYAQGLALAVTTNNLLRLGDANSSSTLAFAAAYIASASLDRQREGMTSERLVLKEEFRDFFWGFELALATMSAHLEVRSGRVSYWSALSGAVLGTAIGIGSQAAHEERLRPSQSWGWGLLGTIPGIVVPFAFQRPTQTAWLRDLRVGTLTGLSPDAQGIALSGSW